jgi:hypothetical protein
MAIKQILLLVLISSAINASNIENPTKLTIDFDNSTIVNLSDNSPITDHTALWVKGSLPYLYTCIGQLKDLKENKKILEINAERISGFYCPILQTILLSENESECDKLAVALFADQIVAAQEKIHSLTNQITKLEEEKNKSSKIIEALISK